MPDLRSLLSTDERKPLQRQRRAALRRMLDVRGITYPTSATKDKLVALVESLDIDPFAPENGTHWEALPQFDENGRQTGVRHYPRDQANGSTSRRVDPVVREAAIQRALAEPSADEEENQNLIDEVRRENLRLQEENMALRDTVQKRLAALEATQLPLESMTAWQLAKVARARGLKVGKNMPKAKLLPMIEAHVNGEDTSQWSERGSEEG